MLRVSEIYQNCRYTKKTQLSLDPKKYRYVTVITGSITTKKPVKEQESKFRIEKGRTIYVLPC